MFTCSLPPLLPHLFERALWTRAVREDSFISDGQAGSNLNPLHPVTQRHRTTLSQEIQSSLKAYQRATRLLDQTVGVSYHVNRANPLQPSRKLPALFRLAFPSALIVTRVSPESPCGQLGQQGRVERKLLKCDFASTCPRCRYSA